MPELVPPVNAMFLFGFPPVETVYGTSSAGEEAKELYSLEEGNPDITEQKGEWHSVEVLKNRSKGLGLVATKDICRGKEILTEKAMITMTPTTANLAMHPPRNHPLLGDAELAREIRAMSPSIQELFYSLSKGPSRNPETLGRILINSLPIDNNQWAIFPQLSRINNSCYANCHWSWNAETKKGQLFCVRKVLVGEELTIAYISHGGTNRYRREKLWRNYGFDCQCDFCVLTGMDFIASDNRQVEIQEICRRIHPRDERMETDPKAAIRDIYELLKLYDGEDIVDARLTDALRRAFDIHVMHGDQGRARFLWRGLGSV